MFDDGHFYVNIFQNEHGLHAHSVKDITYFKHDLMLNVYKCRV